MLCYSSAGSDNLFSLPYLYFGDQVNLITFSLTSLAIHIVLARRTIMSGNAISYTAISRPTVGSLPRSPFNKSVMQY